MQVFYSSAYVAGAHELETTRKARWIADSLRDAPIAGVELVAPTSLTTDDLLAVHDEQYVRAIRDGTPRELAESQSFVWDAGLWPMTLASNGGVVAAVHSALASGRAGSLSSGLHHARRDRGAGYCTFNGLVVAARAALDVIAGSVLILDLDAHCGGGTASLIADESRIWQCDVSVSAFDQYESSDRARLELVRDAEHYLPTIERQLDRLAADDSKFDLCIYNAGMDPFEHCATGGLPGIDRAMLARREELVFSWCGTRGIPVAFVLAGGYLGPSLDQAGLVALHRLTLSAAASSAPETKRSSRGSTGAA